MATNLKCTPLLAASVRSLLALALILAAVLHVNGAQVGDPTAVAMAQPQELIVAGDLKAEAKTALLKPVDALYGFWINSSSALLDEALSPRFIDHTLPPGRPRSFRDRLPIRF
jgi:hypothetical protein